MSSAARAACAVPLPIRSAMASACTRSSLSFRNARSENSPGRGRAGAEPDRRILQQGDDDRAAVRVQLEDGLAGERRWRRKIQRNTGVEARAVGVGEVAIGRRAWFR